MIKGNPLKLMLQFALPLLLGNLLQQTYNIIDAAIVGQILGAKALASVGASSSIQFLVLGFCMGSCTGFGVPVAKYFGAEKIEKMRDYIFNNRSKNSLTSIGTLLKNYFYTHYIVKTNKNTLYCTALCKIKTFSVASYR
jgi:Na+-driven multidrug efflux pump